MMTLIRPSRARCVNATIARHERAVFRFKEGRMLAIAAVYRRAALIRAAVSSVASRFVCRGKGRGGAIRPFEKKPGRFAVGALVRVTKGPFEGRVGTVEVAIKRSTKVVNDFGILQ